MRIFISGGVKNGKSFYAQRLAKAQQTNGLYYIATMRPADSEDDERIVRHLKDRDGWGFATVEQHADIERILEKCDCGGSFLLDSATALLANEMFHANGSVNENACEKITSGLSKVLSQIENIIIVSDYIYSDAIAFDALTEKYRGSLAAIDRFLAAGCDIVLEIVYSNVIVHKGAEKFAAIF